MRDFLVISPIRSFAILAGMFGVLLIFIVPPFAGADEEAHFTRAYGLAKGNVLIYKDEQIELPVSYRETLGCLQTKQAVAGATYTYRYDRYGQEKKATLGCITKITHDPNDTELVRTTAAGYAPFTYIPQVIAIGIGNVFNAPPAILNYLMRLSVLAAYILLIVAAIKIIPTRKWALVGIALLPHAVIQVTNPGGDYMLLGATAVFIATILRSRELAGRAPGKYDKYLPLIVVTAGIFMVLPKGIFPGICFLPLLLFYGGLKPHLLAKMGVAALIFAVGILWQKMVFLSGMNLSGASNSVLDFPYAFIKTMFYEWADSDFLYVRSDMGNDNWMEVGMPAVAITLMNMLFGLYLFVGYVGDTAKKIKRTIEQNLMLITTLLVAGAVIVGSFAALYITAIDMQDGSGVIRGVQARYFYPAFLLLAVMPFVRIIKTSRVYYAAITIVGSFVLLTTLIATVALRYSWL